MRCTERSEMPATAAVAPPVQWVVSPGGLAAGQRRRARHRLRRERRRLARLARLVAQQPVRPPPPRQNAAAIARPSDG